MYFISSNLEEMLVVHTRRRCIFLLIFSIVLNCVCWFVLSLGVILIWHRKSLQISLHLISLTGNHITFSYLLYFCPYTVYKLCLQVLHFFICCASSMRVQWYENSQLSRDDQELFLSICQRHFIYQHWLVIKRWDTLHFYFLPSCNIHVIKKTFTWPWRDLFRR